MKKLVATSALLFLILTGKGIADMGKNLEKATFAGGCFWGMEKIFAELDGVEATRVGYTGGVTQNPTYEQVCSGRTNHAEAIEVTYDPSKISYEDLIEFFFTHHDPTTLNRQGNDVGTQYRSAIFFHDAKQEAAAHRAVELLTKAKVFKNPIKTEITHATEFYPAEDYHQKYLEKNPNGYCHIQYQSAKISEVLKASKAS